MFTKFLTFLTPYKWPIYIGLAVFAITAIFGYGQLKYVQGASDCKNGYAQAQADYQQKVRKEERKRAEAAVKEESKVSKQLSDLKSEKGKVEDEARELARKANRPSECNLRDFELRYYEEAVRGTE